MVQERRVEEFIRLAKRPEFGEPEVLVNDLGPGWGGQPPKMIFHLSKEMANQLWEIIRKLSIPRLIAL